MQAVQILQSPILMLIIYIFTFIDLPYIPKQLCCTRIQAPTLFPACKSQA